MSKNARFKIFDQKTIPTQQSVESAIISTSQSKGYFSIDGTVSGVNSNVQFSCLVGDGDNMQTGKKISRSGVINNNFSFDFQPGYAPYILIKATNTGTGNAEITCRLNFSEE